MLHKKITSLGLFLWVWDGESSHWKHFLSPTHPLLPPTQVLDLREGSTLATGTDAVVGPWSMHAVEAASSRKKSSTRLDYLTLPTDGEYDYILQVGINR